MNFEVIYDPMEEAAQSHLRLDSDRHHVCAPGDWIRWVHRLTGRTSLFVYHHLEQDSYVLADWVVPPHKGPPTAIEVAVLPGPPDRTPPDWDADWFERRLVSHGVQLRRMAAELKARNQARREAVIAGREHQESTVRHLRRHGYDGAAAHMASIPKWRAPDKDSEMAAELRATTQNRIINTE